MPNATNSQAWPAEDPKPATHGTWPSAARGNAGDASRPALERLAPPLAGRAPAFRTAADAFVWHPQGRRLAPVARVNRVDMALLKGIDRMRDTLLENTERFARGLPANNALLWGARGMGKSSLVKAVHAAVNARTRASNGAAQAGRNSPRRHREPADLMTLLRGAPYRFIVFCDDLSFDADDTSYKSLKAVLEGGIEGRPDNVAALRHLQPPSSDAARHDGERALDRDQSRRGGRGEGLAVGPLRAVARLSPLQPGRILAMVEGYVAHFRIALAPTRAPASARMGGHARRALGARGLAIPAGPCRAAGRPRASCRQLRSDGLSVAAFVEERHRIDRRRALADLEVQLRRRRRCRSGRTGRSPGRA